MIVPSRRSDKIKYAVRDIVLLADELVREGRDVLYLNIGDPNKYDFVTPPHMIEACYEAMKKGYNGYSASAGIGEALESIHAEAERKGISNVEDI